jgi:uncharacterized protein YndB with AHSA1/START domain
MKNSAVVRRTIHADPAQVWAVLADGWLYPSWVVGASRMRDVDLSWPSPGSELQHSVGLWPVLLDDRTEVIGSVPLEELRLRAHGWPAGAAEVLIRLEPSEDGTEVTLEEDAVAGPARLIPQPLRQLTAIPRNHEALRRLALLAEGRAA